MKIIGALLCSHPDCCPASRRIGLGVVPEAKQEFRDPSGELVGTVTFPAEVLTMSRVLREVTGREGELYRLSCGHLTPGFFQSNQEYLIINGARVEGKSLVGEFA